MPDYTPRLNIPIPTDTTADDVPADMMAAFQEMEKSGVPRVATVAERNAKHGADSPGSMVLTSSPLAVWIKTESGWGNVWSEPAWHNVSFIGAGGWANVSADVPVSWSRIGDVVYWRGTLRIPDEYDNATWIPIANVPTDAQPSGGGTQRFPCSGQSIGGSFMLRISGGQLQGWIDAAGAGVWVSVPPPYLAV